MRAFLKSLLVLDVEKSPISHLQIVKSPFYWEFHNGYTKLDFDSSNTLFATNNNKLLTLKQSSKVKDSTIQKQGHMTQKAITKPTLR